jgi:NAD(P)-dependent dehydrogenase (short-subunit alcohol dehydrogenase family)
MDKSVVLITGGASGIGYGILKYLLNSNKYTIISVSKSKKNIQLAKEDLKDDSDKILFLQNDITKESECEKIYNIIKSKYGRLDGLINCAGIIKLGGIEKQSLKEWNDSININLTAIFLLTKTLLPLLKQGTNPSVINISSIHSEKPGGSIAYCTSKAGLDMLTKFMAQELTKYKIRVNSINPAFVESNIYLSSGDYSESEYKELINKRYLTYPLGRIGNAYNDIGPMAEFLLSDKSLWTTGSIYVVDGGKSLF